MTFEEVLFKHVKDNFNVSGYSLTFGFGDIKAKAKAPYIIMHVLDSNGDRQVLCDDPFDSGDCFAQFNIYGSNFKNNFAIKRELDTFLNGIRSLTTGSESFKIGLTQHQPSPSGNFVENGLGVDVLAKIFNYEKG